MGWRCSGKLGKDEIDSCISTYDTVEEKERKIDLCDMGRLTFSGDLSLLEHLWIISSSIFPISGALGIAVESWLIKFSYFLCLYQQIFRSHGCHVIWLEAKTLLLFQKRSPVAGYSNSPPLSSFSLATTRMSESLYLKRLGSRRKKSWPSWMCMSNPTPLNVTETY